MSESVQKSIFIVGPAEGTSATEELLEDAIDAAAQTAQDMQGTATRADQAVASATAGNGGFQDAILDYEEPEGMSKSDGKPGESLDETPTDELQETHADLAEKPDVQTAKRRKAIAGELQQRGVQKSLDDIASEMVLGKGGSAIDEGIDYNEILEKAHYTKRTGGPGNYKYEYADDGKVKTGYDPASGKERPIHAGSKTVGTNLGRVGFDAKRDADMNWLGEPPSAKESAAYEEKRTKVLAETPEIDRAAVRWHQKVHGLTAGEASKLLAHPDYKNVIAQHEKWREEHGFPAKDSSLSRGKLLDMVGGLTKGLTMAGIDGLHEYLAKGEGEGTRGGHIVGHYPSGKPIYSRYNRPLGDSLKHAEEHPHGSYRVEDHGAGVHALLFKKPRARYSETISTHGSVEGAKNALKRHSAYMSDPETTRASAKVVQAAIQGTAISLTRLEPVQDAAFAALKEGKSHEEAVAAVRQSIGGKPAVGSKTFQELHGGKGGLIEKLNEYDKNHPKAAIIDRTPAGYGPTEKSMYSGIDALEAFAKGDLPNGEPKLDQGHGDASPNGGDLTSTPRPKAEGAASPSQDPGAPSVPEEKLSEDDDAIGSQLKGGEPGMKEQAVAMGKSFQTYSRQELDQTIAREKAAWEANLRKGQADVVVGVGIATPQPQPEAMEKAQYSTQGEDARVLYSNASDLACERLLKSDNFYQGGEPSLGFCQPSFTRMQPCGSCGGKMSKSLSACPHCGVGATIREFALSKAEASVPVQNRRGPGLRPARSQADLVLPNGVKSGQE